MPTPIITDGTTDRVPNAPRVVLPAAPTFADRAARFAQLARGHALGDFLQLMGHIAQAQYDVFALRPAATPSAEAVQRSRDYGMPPLSALSTPRDAGWRTDLREIVQRVRAAGGPVGALDAVAALTDAEAEALADRILAGSTLDADAALVPFAGAALQVWFARAAAALDVAALEKFDVPTVCPVCATRPVASVVHLGGERNNLRYLHCALCGTEWNMARIQCSACEEDKGVHYLSLSAPDGDGSDATATARRAEACDECKTYLKIFYRDKDAYIDPVADDLASLALDLLVDERGFARSGPNMLFHPGSG
ncbi:MAG: formate dehydrogenase accessory protein FdhE [Betaproteobacteria bacterium]